PQQNPPACDRDEVDCGLTLMDLFGNAANLPYQVVHGGLDELVPYTGAEEWMNRFSEYGSQFEFIAYPHRRHETTFPGTTVGHILRWLDGLPARASTPEKVDYTLVRDMFQPEYGLSYDGAYWIDDLLLADGAGDGRIIADRGGRIVQVESFTGVDNLGPYHLRRRTPSGDAPTDTMALTLEGIQAGTIDAAAIGWDGERRHTIVATSDGPSTIRLDGDFRNSTPILGAQFSRNAGDVILHLPAGSSLVTIG
ncbi:MAG TPA: hypothetical protein VM600_09700, partial [Actinomycetota bacterium]|nr:hypothetical protein [Actinomycetota bacterium]